jgi:lysozyme
VAGKTRVVVTAAMIAAASSVGVGLNVKWEGPIYNYAYDDARPKYTLKPGDPVYGTLTNCRGHTGNMYDGTPIVIGKFYSNEFCEAQHKVDWRVAEQCVLRYTPDLYANKYTAGAAQDFCFNVGAGNYSTSTMVKLFNRGETRKGCEELIKWTYTTVKNVKVKSPGLFNRRKDQLATCITELT